MLKFPKGFTDPCLKCFRIPLNILNLLEYLYRIYGKKILQVYITYKVPLLLSDRTNPNLIPARSEGEGKHNYVVN